MLGPVGAPEAAAILADVRAGRPGVDVGAPLGPPVLVVDLDGATGPGPDLRPPAGWPCVVVGYSTALAPVPPVGADVVLTTAVDAPAPWVTVADAAGTAVALAARIDGHPQAATTLVQVLRTGAGLDVDAALVLESLAYATLQAGPEHLAWLRERPGRPGDDRTDPAVRVERHGDVLGIVLNRPERRNAYSTAMRDGLFAALEVAAADPAIAEVRLSGAGGNFCSGGDLAEFGLRPDPATAHGVRMARSCGAALARLGPRAYVALRGACVGAGLELAAFAGRVDAAGDLRGWLPEIGMGLIPGAGGTVSLPRRIGAGRAAWLALSGEAVDHATALRWGLVDA